MAVFRIRHVESKRQPEKSNRIGHLFQVFAQAEEHPCQTIQVFVAPSDIHTLQYEKGLQGFPERERIQQAVIRYAIQRIEHRLREGLFPTEPSSKTYDMPPFQEEDIASIRQLLREKTCTYQRQEGRDLLCSAASAEDKTAYGKIGFRFVAPTSRAICYTCNLPDTDYLCSHFLHPEILAKPGDNGRMARQLVKGICDIGKDEVQQPEQCRAGDNECWEWLIEPVQEPLVIPASPFALPEAFDFLDAVWRNTFNKRPLLQLRGTTNSAKITQSCTTREEFQSQLSALADIFKMMDIPNDLLKDKTIKKDHTFARLFDCMKGHLEPIDYQGAESAIKKLQSINGVRTALQHSAAYIELPKSFEKLGIKYTSQWGHAWDRIRAVTIEALRVIREKVQTIDLES